MVKEHFLNWAFIEMPQETLIDQIDPNNQRPDQSQDPLIGHSLLSQLGIRDRGLFHPTTHLTKSVFPLLYNLALKKNLLHNLRIEYASEKLSFAFIVPYIEHSCPSKSAY